MAGNQCDVVILCGGLGKRLRSVVADRPKPMAEIGGKPFVRIMIEHVASFGFRRFILSTGYKAEMIADHFRSVSLPFELEIAVELRAMGTAGGLKNAYKLLRAGTTLVLNGDSFCSVDYLKMLAEHQARKADATIAVVPVPDAGEYGSIGLDAAGRITAFDEKKGRGQGLVNAGVYVFRKEVIESMSSAIPLSLEEDVFPGLIKGSLFAHVVSGPLLDIGTPEGYRKARKALPTMMGRAH